LKQDYEHHAQKILCRQIAFLLSEPAALKNWFVQAFFRQPAISYAGRLRIAFQM
jgi:hypothetical protein